MRKTTLSIAMIAMLVGSGAMFNGCDVKRGCMDVNSDNYNAEAEEDDDTCIPMRDKFAGEYEANGELDRTGDPIDDLQPNGQPDLIVEDIGLSVSSLTLEDVPGQLIFGFSNVDGTQFPLRGVVTSKFHVVFEIQQLGDVVYFGYADIGGRTIDVHLTRVFLSSDLSLAPHDTDLVHILGLRNPCCDCYNVNQFQNAVICNGDPQQQGQSWASFRATLVDAGCECEY